MTPDGVRGRNLSRLLTLLHREGPLSRADLTRRTGLNRSTIAALVTELGTLGAAFETEPAESGTVGRPSPTVHPQGRIVALTVNPDVDAVTAAAEAGGATVREQPATFVSGDRFASVIDPFGVRWSIMTRVEDLSPEESARRVAEWAAAQG